MGLRRIFLVGIVIATVATNMCEAQSDHNRNGTDIKMFGIPLTLYCTPDGGMSALGLATPPFKGADILFQCGCNGTIAKGTTNPFGICYITVNSTSVLPFFPPESNCNIFVNTTLSTCDPVLPSTGHLLSGLKFAGTIAIGRFKVANYAPAGFVYNSTL